MTPPLATHCPFAGVLLRIPVRCTAWHHRERSFSTLA